MYDWASMNINMANLSDDIIYTNFSNSTVDFEVYELPEVFRWVILSLYACVFAIAIFGNVVVIRVNLSVKTRRRVTSVFICSLAISDITMGSMCVPFTVISDLIYNYWPFSSFLCPAISYLQLVAVLQRAFALIALTYDRHYAITSPMGKEVSRIRGHFMVVIFWILSGILALPSALKSRVVYFDDRSEAYGLCIEEWATTKAKQVYSVMLLVVQYCLPLVVLFISHLRVGTLIWLRKIPGEKDTSRDERIKASRRKNILLLLALVVVYAVTWLPIHVITIIGDMFPVIYNHQISHIIWLSCHWLAFCDCCTYPVTYLCLNKKLRKKRRFRRKESTIALSRMSTDQLNI